ncbi:MAG: hypothetical protein JSW50_02095, partial [Candidatus Latescibacterota bacterium]
MVTSVFLLASGIIAANFGCSSQDDKTQIAADSTISPAMMREDFEFVVQKLKRVHPTTIDGFSDYQEKVILTIRDELDEPLTTEQFFFKINELFHSFHDAHTTQWLVFSREIDLPLVWLQSGLYIERNTRLLKKGDRVLSIGGMETGRLADRLYQIFWTENRHLVRLEASWMLTARPYLRHLGLVEDNSVEVICQRAGQKVVVRLPMIKLDRPPREEKPTIAYSTDKAPDVALLTLNSCRYDDEYRSTIRTLF